MLKEIMEYEFKDPTIRNMYSMLTVAFMLMDSVAEANNKGQESELNSEMLLSEFYERENRAFNRVWYAFGAGLSMFQISELVEAAKRKYEAQAKAEEGKKNK